MNCEPIDIVIVEDNPSDLKLMLKALQRNHLTNKIIALKDGEEALEFLFKTGQYKDFENKHKPKVVFLDLKLPKVDGIEVLKKIRESDYLKTVPVVVLTSSKEERDIIDTYNLGVNSYIVKPVEFEDFVEAVSRLGFYWVLLNESPN